MCASGPGHALYPHGSPRAPAQVLDPAGAVPRPHRRALDPARGWLVDLLRASGTLVAGLHSGHLEGVGGHVGGLVGGRELDRVLVLAVH